MGQTFVTRAVHAAAAILSLVFSACGVVTQEIYMQEVDVKAPVFQPPVFIADSAQAGQFRLSPHLSFRNATTFRGFVEGHTRVNRDGVYQLDTTRNGNEITLRETPGANVYKYGGQNLRWITPNVVAGLQGSLALNKGISLVFGGQYSAVGAKGLWGWNVGLGFQGVGADIATRLDGGLHWTPVAYDALTVIVNRTSLFGSSSEDVFVFHDIGTETNLGFYGSLSLSTRLEHWPVNLLINLGVSRQRLTSYQPHTSAFPFLPYASYTSIDVRTSAWVTFMSLTPGVYLTLGNGSRLLAGARWNKGTDGVTEGFISPFVQFEVVL